MKRVVAFSDSHGDKRSLQQAVEQALRLGHVDAAVFLGDGVNDFEQVRPLLMEKKASCHVVSGNNDRSSYEPQELLFRIGKVAFYACHGHTRYVKYGLDRLYLAAREREAHVALYGHTHVPSLEMENGVYLVNPGAVCEYSRHKTAYAEILVDDDGTVTVHLVPMA